MGDIKSAREIAMEKVAKLDEVTKEERLKWKYEPEGEKLATRYTKEDCNLVTELSQYEEKARKYVVDGIIGVLSRNISIPKNNLAKKANQKAMDGIKTLKKDKIAVENVFSKIRRVFDHYGDQGEQQRKQAYQQLKTEFTEKIQQAMQQQLGSFPTVEIAVERQPQFQEEWQRLQTQLDLQYVRLLNEYKQELLNIS
ncbi:hypothetical protein ACFLWZ_05315 [Chloroflexota bacterium]